MPALQSTLESQVWVMALTHFSLMVKPATPYRRFLSSSKNLRRNQKPKYFLIYSFTNLFFFTLLSDLIGSANNQWIIFKYRHPQLWSDVRIVASTLDGMPRSMVRRENRYTARVCPQGWEWRNYWKPQEALRALGKVRRHRQAGPDPVCLSMVSATGH